MADIARNIKKIRKECGYTQEWLAENLGVSQTAIALWENGTRTPSIDIIEKIANLLDVRPSYLIGWDDRDITIDFEIDELLKELSKEDLTQEQVTALVQKIETLINEQKQVENNIEKINTPSNMDTIVSHFDGDEYTEEELEEIRQFAEFVKSKRNK